MRIVRDQQGLERLVADLRAAGEFALDTEFIPENRLFPELGLIQAAAAGVEAVVDPLEVKKLDPLFALISDPGILKVVHSGKHDFDIFYGLASVVPKNVFDTQIAAAVIGHGKKVQIALRTLVAGFVGRELSKQEQMSNWLRRPLTPRQVDYAIADVRYLLPLRNKLTERARALGRLDWLREEMIPLTEEDSYRMPPAEECYRALDSPSLTPSQRGSLRELAAWRERRARASNRPRGWILKDGAVRDLARRQPRNREQLLAPYESVAGRPPKGDPKTIQQTRAVLQKNPDAILRLLGAGARKPLPFTGKGKKERRPAPESLALLLETWLKLRASEHGGGARASRHPGRTSRHRRRLPAGSRGRPAAPGVPPAHPGGRPAAHPLGRGRHPGRGKRPQERWPTADPARPSRPPGAFRPPGLDSEELKPWRAG